ncbi:MAG: Integrase catalytic region [Geminicoccaceae bacterium]|jgi:putative transposase|nr:Integrase catalytic region [Geminicoccaceae bacterium]
MSKRTKQPRAAAAVGQGQAMQLTHRLPKLPDPPTLSATAKRRLDAVEFSFRHGVPLACEAFKVSRSTLYRWRQCYQPRKLETLEPRSRAPKRQRAVCWSWEDEQRILTLRQRHPRWGKRKLLPLLRSQGCTLSEATIGRILRRLKHSGRLKEPQSVRTRRPRPPRAYATRKPASYQPQQPGDLLQIDTVHVRPLPGVELRQFTAVDVVSRVGAFAVRTRATAGTAAEFLDELLERFPLRIRAIQVDGGSEFMAEFEDACADADIPLFELPPRSPKLNGCVERLNRTAREEFWECYDGDLDLASVTPALRDWEDEYNRVRPHQALQMRAPLAALATR